MPSPRIQNLLDREMSRKEFLAFAVFAVASVFGITGLIRELASHAATPAVNIEPETGTVTAPATTVTDGTASGIRAVQFGSVSVTAMPTGDWTDQTTGVTWKEVWTEDFVRTVPGANVDAATGVANWRPTAPSALPSNNPYAAKMGMYERPIPDTYNQALYYSERTTWTENSALVINCHAENVPEKGVVYPLAGTFIPKLANYRNTFIRLQFRYRAITNVPVGTASRYGGVWQGINSSNWPAYGEYDYPEADFNGNIGGFQHYANTAGGQNVVAVSSPTVAIKDTWSICTQQWEPSAAGGGGSGGGRMRWFVDGRTVLDTQNQVGGSGMPMVFMFQCGTHANGNPPDLTTTARVEIDWVTIHAHPSSTAYDDTPKLSLSP